MNSRSFLIALAGSLSLYPWQATFSQDSLTLTADDHYELGRTAYGEEDYITALKHLYAYKVLAWDDIHATSGAVDIIDESINAIETKLNEFKRVAETVSSYYSGYLLMGEEYPQEFNPTPQEINWIHASSQLHDASSFETATALDSIDIDKLIELRTIELDILKAQEGLIENQEDRDE